MPKDWQFIPAATLAFSGCFLLVWVATALWRLCTGFYWLCAHSMRSKTFEDQEVEFLCSLARQPDTPLNLRAINYDNSLLSRFEFTHLASSLERKGLVRFGPHERAIVMLTARGEQVAVQAIEAKKGAI